MVTDARKRVGLPQLGQNFLDVSLHILFERNQWFITGKIESKRNTNLKQAWHLKTQLFTLSIFRPSTPTRPSPICNNTFCIAKSAVIHATGIVSCFPLREPEAEGKSSRARDLCRDTFEGVIHSPSPSSDSDGSSYRGCDSSVSGVALDI